MRYVRGMNGSLASSALLILRLAFGGLMVMLHGWPKLEKLLAGNTQFADPLGIGSELSLLLAALAEFVAGLLVSLGIATRGALVPLILTMVVAVFVQHSADPLAKKELGLLYLAAYCALFLAGPGRYSVSSLYHDRLRNKVPRVLRFLLS